MELPKGLQVGCHSDDDPELAEGEEEESALGVKKPIPRVKIGTSEWQPIVPCRFTKFLQFFSFPKASRA
jgi:hypothetical protein